MRRLDACELKLLEDFAGFAAVCLVHELLESASCLILLDSCRLPFRVLSRPRCMTTSNRSSRCRARNLGSYAANCRSAFAAAAAAAVVVAAGDDAEMQS